MPINYIIGDAAKPVLADKETGVLVHCCNDIGTWGAGFVLALSKRWSAPEAAYRAWSKDGGQAEVPFKLGQVCVGSAKFMGSQLDRATRRWQTVWNTTDSIRGYSRRLKAGSYFRHRA